MTMRSLSTTLLLLSSTLPLLVSGSSPLQHSNHLDPAERMLQTKELIAKFKSELPSSSAGKSNERHTNPNMYHARTHMKSMIQEIKQSVPYWNEKEEIQQAPAKEQEAPPKKEVASSLDMSNTTLASRRNEHEQQDKPQVESKFQRMKRAFDDIRPQPLNDVIRLTLTKPLGFFLDANHENEAIVFLDDKYPGAVQELSKDIQQELVDRRIVKVNHEDVMHLNLYQVAELVLAADSPVAFEFATVVKDDDSHNHEDDNDVLILTLDKPLGFILDADNEDEAIVFSLDEEYPGAAHQLSKQVQEQLVGRRIISVNSKDVSQLNLLEVAELIVAADSPVTLEFEVVEEEDEDEAPSIDYYDTHYSETVKPGQVSLLKWNDNHDIIDPYAAQVGLPPKLVPTIQAYAKRLQIIEGLKDVLYKNPCEPENGRFYETENPHLPTNDEFPFNAHNDELLWYAQRPGSHWNSDMHWFAGSDERTHESMLRMLFEGGIAEVLEGIGTHFELDGLFIQSVGFLGVTHCEEGYLHKDFSDVDGKFFNLLIPLESPNGSGPELNVAGERTTSKNETATVGTKIKYSPDFGVLVGDWSLHGTRECDHRPQGGIRVVLSIYLADITATNVDNVAYDDTAIFPVPEVQGWLWSQQGRHWRKDQCMIADVGRKPFKAIDHSDRCEEVKEYGKCDSNPKLARKHCAQSCNVYMEDWEYRPGVARSEVMGDFDFVVE